MDLKQAPTLVLNMLDDAWSRLSTLLALSQRPQAQDDLRTSETVMRETKIHGAGLQCVNAWAEEATASVRAKIDTLSAVLAAIAIAAQFHEATSPRDRTWIHALLEEVCRTLEDIDGDCDEAPLEVGEAVHRARALAEVVFSSVASARIDDHALGCLILELGTCVRAVKELIDCNPLLDGASSLVKVGGTVQQQKATGVARHG